MARFGEILPDSRSSKEKDEVIFVCGICNNALHGAGRVPDVDTLTQWVINARAAFQRGFAAFYEEETGDIIPVISDVQKEELWDLVMVTHTEPKRIFAHFKIKELDELPADRFETARNLLLQKLAKRSPDDGSTAS